MTDTNADIEQRIRAWRQGLSPALAKQADVVDELEAHLRDEVDALVRAGRTPDDAWAAAVASLGDAHALDVEFRKASRSTWLPGRAAIIVLGTGALIVGMFMWARVASGGLGALIAAHIFTITTGYAATLALGFAGAFAVVSRATGNAGPRLDAEFRRAGTILVSAAIVLTLVGVVLGGVWSSEHVGRYWAWDSREVGGLCVLVWQCAVLACLRSRRRHGAGADVAMTAATLGNAVVAMAWTAPLMFAQPRPAGFPAWWGPLVIAFVISQVALAFAGVLLPPGWLKLQRASS